MKDVFILAASDNALIGEKRPRDNVIAVFRTQEFAEEYQRVYGLKMCTTIFPLKFYRTMEEVRK